jgi:hypothetical protein
MKLYVDLDLGRIVDAPGYTSPRSDIRVRKNDIRPFVVQFVRNGVIVDPSVEAEALYLTVKAKNFFNQASALTSQTSFTKTGSGTSTQFAALISFATNSIQSIFDLMAGTEYHADLELRWSNTLQTTWGSAERVNCIIENTVYSASVPNQPSTGNPTFLTSVTSLTGGGSTALDGVITSVVTVPQLYIVSLSTSSQLWILVAGTEAEDVAGGIVRPDDYNATTNAKVFKRIG